MAASMVQGWGDGPANSCGCWERHHRRNNKNNSYYLSYRWGNWGSESISYLAKVTFIHSASNWLSTSPCATHCVNRQWSNIWTQGCLNWGLGVRSVISRVFPLFFLQCCPIKPTHHLLFPVTLVNPFPCTTYLTPSVWLIQSTWNLISLWKWEENHL